MTTHVFNVELDGTGPPDGIFQKVMYWLDKYKRWVLLATSGLALSGGLQMLIAASSVPDCCSQTDYTTDIMIILFAITSFVEAVRFCIGVFAHPLTPSHMGICELLGSVTSVIMAVVVIWYTLLPSPFMKTFDYSIVVIITSFYESIQLYHKYFTGHSQDNIFEEFPFLKERPALTCVVLMWFYLRMSAAMMAMIGAAMTFGQLSENTFIFDTDDQAWRILRSASKELPLEYFLRTGNSSANYEYSYYNVTYDVRRLWDGSTVSQNCTLVYSMQEWEDAYDAANGSDDAHTTFTWDNLLCQWDTTDN